MISRSFKLLNENWSVGTKSQMKETRNKSSKPNHSEKLILLLLKKLDKLITSQTWASSHQEFLNQDFHTRLKTLRTQSSI